MCSTLPLPLCGGSWDLSGYQKSLAPLPRTQWIGHSQMYVENNWVQPVNKETADMMSHYSLTHFLSVNFFLLLPQVVDDVNCALCDSPGDLLDQLFCTSCGQHYHGICLDMAVTPLRRAGWQCPECKICQTCKWVGFPLNRIFYTEHFLLFLHYSFFL